MRYAVARVGTINPYTLVRVLGKGESPSKQHQWEVFENAHEANEAYPEDIVVATEISDRGEGEIIYSIVTTDGDVIETDLVGADELFDAYDTLDLDEDIQTTTSWYLHVTASFPCE